MQNHDIPKASAQTDGNDYNQESLSDQQSCVSEENVVTTSKTPTKGQKLRRFSSKTKQKTKRIFHISDRRASVEYTSFEGVGIIENDPAFNPTMLQQQQAQQPKEQQPHHTVVEKAAKKTLDNLHSVAIAVIHPKDTIKSKVTKITAGTLSHADRPFLSHNADLDFLNAHDEMNQAYSATSAQENVLSDKEDEKNQYCQTKVVEMEARRESLRIAWITSKHISRVRVVPKRHIQYPDLSEFYVKNGNDNSNDRSLLKIDWLKWLGYYIIHHTQDFSAQYIDDFDELPFDVDSLRRHVERAMVASAPWQSWAMSVRSVYRWENPYHTGKWLAIYVVLWYTEHLIGFLYGYIIYLVIRNKFYPTSVETLRKSMQRALDSERKPYKFGELVDKHGRDSWLEPLLEDLGPYMQLQIGDIANMLEVFHNFYHWKSPRKTAGSLSLIAACLLIALFTDMGFCMKIVWFLVGVVFFLCWPIASLYPKYRYLVSPLKWALWEIPTDAEWSFQYLRRQAQISRERMIHQQIHNDSAPNDATPPSPKPSTPPPAASSPTSTSTDTDASASPPTHPPAPLLNPTPILSFRAHSHNKPGHLIIHARGLRFERRRRLRGRGGPDEQHPPRWSRTFLELAEMRKLDGSALARLTRRPLAQLELTFVGGEVVLLEGMRDRDEAFNAIIGVSALQWQSLQTAVRKADGEGGGE